MQSIDPPAVVIVQKSDCARLPRDFVTTSNSFLVLCACNSSMQAKCELSPSLVESSDALGKNLQFFSGIRRELFNILSPKASASSCLLCCAIAFASSKTIRA